ncbi:MAG TPA: type II CAAX endopeptidase family protein [Rhizomicrobium sp.]|nr:type II CAAX endopeptidase family protein [Rhizomicrobium sp.]
MTGHAPPAAASSRTALVAPLWHTALLVSFFVGLGLAGHAFQTSATIEAPTHHPGVVPLYLSILAAEWALLYFVWQGARRRGTPLRELIGGRWTSVRAALADIALGLSLGVLWIGVNAAWSWLGPSHAKSVGALLPVSGPEIALWLAVSLTAGFCEETVFRGYLQKQLAALTGSGTLAVVLQAAVFGAGHAYQGINAAANTALYGLVLGALALWRKSVRPSIVAHAWSDIFGGVLSRLV